jgi:hypothetical protein
VITCSSVNPETERPSQDANAGVKQVNAITKLAGIIINFVKVFMVKSSKIIDIKY